MRSHQAENAPCDWEKHSRQASKAYQSDVTHMLLPAHQDAGKPAECSFCRQPVAGQPWQNSALSRPAIALARRRFWLDHVSPGRWPSEHVFDESCSSVACLTIPFHCKPVRACQSLATPATRRLLDGQVLFGGNAAAASRTY